MKSSIQVAAERDRHNRLISATEALRGDTMLVSKAIAAWARTGTRPHPDTLLRYADIVRASCEFMSASEDAMRAARAAFEANVKEERAHG